MQRWDHPYLETCCRAALHRLVLAGAAGRPAMAADASCLDRLVGMGLAERQTTGGYRVSEAGARRYTALVPPGRGRWEGR